MATLPLLVPAARSVATTVGKTEPADHALDVDVDVDVDGALDYVDAQVGTLLHRISVDGLAASTTVILSAKHGQSPVNPATLRRVDDSVIIAGLDEAWAAAHPKAAPLVVFSTDDDVMLLSLSDRSPAALAFAKKYLLTHSAAAGTITDGKGVHSTTVASSGLTRVYTGADADKFVGAKAGDPNVPDLIGITQHGVVYTGGVKKIAEHGGDSTDDRNVALVVSGAGVAHGRTVRGAVATTQIAPTILHQLGLNPRSLDAVRLDGTKVLPQL